MIDSQCTLHALVFEPTDIAANDSIGKLTDYILKDACTGDINTFKAEEVIAGGTTTPVWNETVNIRIGAAVSDSWLGFAFGLSDHQVVMYARSTSTGIWVRN